MNIQQKIKQVTAKSPYHGVFLSEALRFYTDQMFANEEQTRKDLEKQGLIHPDTWFEIARDFKEAIK